MTGAALAVCSVFTIIAAVHLYWAAGGTTWKAGAIPSRDGVPVLSPSSAITALVGVALLGTAAVVGSTAGLLPRFLPTGLLRGASAVLALVFAVRAVGEFHYVGFFKRVRGERLRRTRHLPLLAFVPPARGLDRACRSYLIGSECPQVRIAGNWEP